MAGILQDWIQITFWREIKMWILQSIHRIARCHNLLNCYNQNSFEKDETYYLNCASYRLSSAYPLTHFIITTFLYVKTSIIIPDCFCCVVFYKCGNWDFWRDWNTLHKITWCYVPGLFSLQRSSPLQVPFWYWNAVIIICCYIRSKESWLKIKLTVKKVFQIWQDPCYICMQKIYMKKQICA